MAENSVIGSATVVSGHVRGEGSLEILGRVEGDVTISGELVVGATGRIRGNVSATELRIAGQVQGNLRGAELVSIERGARVVGDIASPRIGIAPGALVRGHVQTDGEPALSPSNVAAVKRPGTLPRMAPPQAAPARVPAAPPAPASVLKVPQRPEPQRPEPQRAEPRKLEPQRPEPQRPDPQRPEPQRAELRKLEPARATPSVATASSSAASVGAEADFTPPRPVKAEPRRPPPPVVPVISKGTKAKKKRRD